jgi:hypothetical protein
MKAADSLARYHRIKNDPEFIEKRRIYSRKRYQETKAAQDAKSRKYRINNREKMTRMHKRLYRSKLTQYMCNGARYRARCEGIDFELVETDIVIPKFCPILGIPIAIAEGAPNRSSPSVDRINNDIGYIPGNIHVISLRANWIKRNASVDDLKLIHDYVLNPYSNIVHDETHSTLRSRLLGSARSRANKNGLRINISKGDILIPTCCPVLGIPLRVGVGRLHDNSPSLDRIDNNDGYIKGNINVVSLKANSIKKDATPKELQLLHLYMYDLSIKIRN